MVDFARQLLPVNIEDEMRQSYMDYAMSVIVGRALPDARDGLKPVHRRVLFAMHEANIAWNRPYVKCARVVGDVMGKYHPHGDNAIYDTLVRMAQDFSLRYTLVDGQGNFGSIDGDAAAAMRYTECRLDRIASELLADIDRETVDFVPNYDGKELEPTVLPARIPNLLINGSDGIAVGMATKIPPHNIGEVVDACIALIDTPEMELDELLQIVPGPDRWHHQRRRRHSRGLSHRSRHDPRPRQGRDRESRQRLAVDCRHRTAVSGQQGGADRENRRVGP